MPSYSKVWLSTVLALLITALTGAYALEEPGTSFSTALEVKPGEYSFNLEQETVHYFKIYVEQGDTLIITLRMPRGQDFDIVVFDPLLDLVDRGIKPTGLSERLGVLAPVSGYYYFAVFGFAGSSGTYTLSISILKPPVKTVTVTDTYTQREFRTVTQVEVVSVTQTVREMVTVTSTTTRTVETIPWGVLGFAVLAFAIIYASATFSDVLSKRERAIASSSGHVQPSGQSQDSEKQQT